MKKALIIFSMILFVLNSSACSKQTTTTSKKTYPPAKVGLYLPPYDDYFYNFEDLAKKGLEDIQKEYPIKVETLKVKDAVYEVAYADKLAKDKDIVVFMSFPLNKAYSELTVNYPDKYIIGIESYIDGLDYDEPENGSGIFARDEQGGYLAGVLAALLTTRTEIPGINKDKKVGLIGAIQSPWLNRTLGGFQQAVWTLDPQITVTERWGDNKNPKMFNDPEWAYKKAKELYEKQNVDIIFAVGGKTAEGVYKAAAETGKYAISMDGNKSYLAPGHVLAGINRRVDVMIYKELKDYLEKRKQLEEGLTNEIIFHAGSHKYGIAEGAIEISDLAGMDEERQWLEENKITQAQFDKIKTMKEQIPQEVIDAVAQYRDQIISGAIEVREYSGPIVKPQEVKDITIQGENEIVE